MYKNIANNLENYRTPPIIQTKYEYPEGSSHLSKVKKKKLYKYYICSYCGQEIIVDNNQGGIIEIPATVTKNKRIILALHNGCVKPVLQQIENKNMIRDNMKHIPTIDLGSTSNDIET